MSRMQKRTSALFTFPNPVNEISARLVAGGVVAQVALFFVTRWPVILITLTYGFVARVVAGPTLSPLGQFVTRVVTPRLPFPETLVPGPPKRFAQGMGVAFSTTALIMWFSNAHGLAVVVLCMLLSAATLESVFGFCLGCKVFGLLMRVGVIPDDVCAECSNLSLRRTATLQP